MVSTKLKTGFILPTVLEVATNLPLAIESILLTAIQCQTWTNPRFTAEVDAS